MLVVITGFRIPMSMNAKEYNYPRAMRQGSEDDAGNGDIEGEFTQKLYHSGMR